MQRTQLQQKYHLRRLDVRKLQRDGLLKSWMLKRMQRHERALAKAQAIRMKLGGSGSMAELFPLKPKGMHNRTYQRLRLEARPRTKGLGHRS